MRDGQRSTTAAGVALARALEHQRAERDRILSDPYAAAFVPRGTWRLVATRRFAARIAVAAFDRTMPGMIELVAARGRYADELVVSRTLAGAEQLVLLGAGFDTAPLRLEDALAGIAVFEIDHPATQARKREILRDLTGRETPATRFVPIDFERDDVAARLTAAGFEPGAPSIVTWMGVSYYLSAEAVASTLERLAALMSSGSTLCFDFVLPSVIDGTCPHPAARLGARRAARFGEPFLFGISPRETGPLLERFGFRLAEQARFDELARRYTRGARSSVDFAWLVTAERL